MKKKSAKSDESDDDISEGSNEIDTDNSPKNIPIYKLGDKLKNKKIVINISDTQYPIIEEIAEELGWIVQKTEGLGDWDLWWTDREIQPNTLFKMHLFQKINHFPGIYVLARKNLLGLNLMGMRQQFPNQYNFFPETWTIPYQFSQFRHYYETIEKGKTRTYIVKPEALSQGRGIFLTRNIEDIINGNKYVIQRYLKNPLLIDKLKFDLRIYVLLAGTDPLRLYIYNEGLARFATEQYQEPTPENLNKSYIHLTNYSLNKSNPKYIFNASDKEMDKGHKRSLSSIYQKLEKLGHNVTQLKLQIEDAIIKTVISGLPSIRHQYQYCQPEEYQGNMCFHILGFDVMITDQLKPIVIEVNHTPSFQTGTPLDYLIKKNLIKDTLKIMRITSKNKKKMFEKAKEIAKVRLETGKREIFKGKEREEILLRVQKQRDQLEEGILGGYKKVHPDSDIEVDNKYKMFYQHAYKLSREDNEARKKLMNEEKLKEKLKNIKKSSDSPVKMSSTKQVINRKAEEENYRTLNTKAIKSDDNIELTLIESQLLKQVGKQMNGNQLKLIRKISIENDLLPSVDSENSYDIKRLMEEYREKKFNFRTKINKKNHPLAGSNNQLVKYTQSIKKFNELMVKYVVGKDPEMNDSLLEEKELETEAFLKIKQKVCQNRDGKTPLYHEIINNSGLKQDGKNGNGSFVRPKNYQINDQKHFNFTKNSVPQKKNGDGVSINRQILSLNGHMHEAIVMYNNSSKAYSKLLKKSESKNMKKG